MSDQMMTYEGAGVSYAGLDNFKRRAMLAGMATKHFMEALGFVEFPWSRGESAYVFQHRDSKLILAFLVEGLGTKNLIAEDGGLRSQFDRTYYDWIAQCNVAMHLNDLITVGAMPLVFGMHAALEDGKHLADQRGIDLIDGTCASMQEAKCVYGPGETPALSGIVERGTMCLGGAAIGVVRTEKHLLCHYNVKAGQRIVLLESSGMHANGLSLARAIANKLPHRYLTDIGEGVTLGEALLTPTRLYVEFVRRCQDAGVKIAYAVNVTGHGWRKLMRAPQPLMYVIDRAPEIPRLFRFLMERGPVTMEEMYKTFNMGAGFAVFVEASQVDGALEIARVLHIPAIDAGEVRKGHRSVHIEPRDITFTELDLRA